MSATTETPATVVLTDADRDRMVRRLLLMESAICRVLSGDEDNDTLIAVEAELEEMRAALQELPLIPRS
jgi:hypothetical protein